MSKFKRGDRVVVTQDNEGGGGGNWAVGKEFIFEYYDVDGGCEVRDPEDADPGTYLFFECQLKFIPSVDDQ